jgi:signal transduction histidine kinase
MSRGDGTVAAEAVVWTAFAVTALLLLRADRSARWASGTFATALAFCVLVTGVATALSISHRRLRQRERLWSWAPVVVAPLLAVPIASQCDSPVVRLLLESCTLLVAPLAAWWTSRGFGTGAWMYVLVPTAAAMMANLLLRDPYRERYCAPICAPNPFALGHAAAAVTATGWSVVAGVTLWCKALVTRRSAITGHATVASLAIAATTLAALSSATRRSRSAHSAVSRDLASGIVVLVSAAILAALVPLVGAAVGRRRVRRWARELGDLALPGAALQLVRRAANDPSLVVMPVGAAVGGASTELRRGGRAVAIVQHRIGVAARVDAALTPTVTTALENDLLLNRAQAQLDDLYATRSALVKRSDDARRRLERDLHDGAQQRLLALGMRLSLMADASPDDRRAELAATVDHAARALAELRRIAHGVIPPIVDDAGLFEALCSLAEATPTVLTLDIAPVRNRRYASDVERACYRLVAGTPGDHITVRITVDPLRVRVGSAAPPFDRIDDEDRIAAVGGSLRAAADSGEMLWEVTFA